MNSFHGGMNSGTRWNEFIPGGMNSFYSRVSYTVVSKIGMIRLTNYVTPVHCFTLSLL